MARRRLATICQHVSPSSTSSSTTTTTTITSPSSSIIAKHFDSVNLTSAWEEFCNVDSWRQRIEIVSLLRQSPTGWHNYLQCYRKKIAPFICPEFYQALESPTALQQWRHIYSTTGELNIPFLRPSCLPHLSKYCDGIESKGKRRYGQPRPSYPPGEWANYDDSDPRKSIQTEVNMTAVASRHLNGADDDILWIYHSPHLQLFIEQALGTQSLFPYLSDLGIAVNIMRPRPDAQTALGFHFDSVDSSTQKDKHSDIQQQKGVTGVIGLLDANEGGERIVFQNVHRENWKDVTTIVHKYDPLKPTQSLTERAVPKVEDKPTAGMLYLFDGGNVLHGVSSVRKGSRIALAFLYSEAPPSETSVSEASADFFYKN